MKFSTKSVYGLKAMLYLADSYRQRAVSASQIAKEEGLSAAYLEQILHLLKKKQWVKSLRGPSGGYVLSKKPSDVHVGSVLRDLEGERPAAKKVPDRASRTPNTAALAALMFWDRLARQYAEWLDAATLESLLLEARKLQKRDSARSERHHFSI